MNKKKEVRFNDNIKCIGFEDDNMTLLKIFEIKGLHKYFSSFLDDKDKYQLIISSNYFINNIKKITTLPFYKPYGIISEIDRSYCEWLEIWNTLVEERGSSYLLKKSNRRGRRLGDRLLQKIRRKLKSFQSQKLS
jgi:hypothetical protein